MPGESVAHYGREKSKLLRRCPHALTKPERVYYLIRGVERAEHYSILMSAPPATVAQFIDEVRRLEENCRMVNGLATPPVFTGGSNVPSPALDFKSLADALVNEVTARLGSSVPFSPLVRPFAIPGQQPARRPLSEVQCFGG